MKKGFFNARLFITGLLTFHCGLLTITGAYASGVVEYNNVIWQQIDDGKEYTLEEAKQYCTDLTLENITDWRVPTVTELQSIYGCFDDDDFTNLNATQPGCPDFQRTTSTMFLAVSDTDPNEAWGVLDTDMAMALTTILVVDPEGAMSKPVRCVKGETTMEETENIVPIVTSILFDQEQFPCRDRGLTGPETATWKGQEWQRCDNSKKYTWDDGDAYCENLVLDGKSDWRMPTILELRGLVFCSNGVEISMDLNQSTTCDDSSPFDSPTIDPAFQCEPYFYWGEYGSDYLEMYVNFEDGFSFGSSKLDEHYIRCIREE